MVITGVADRAPGLVSALVYCDAYLPADGESCWELAGPEYRQLFAAGASGDGFSVAPPTRLDPRASAHPLASFLQAIRLTGAWQEVRRREFVYLSNWAGSPFGGLYRRLAEDPEWITHTLPTGHNIMADAPDEFLEILLDTARALSSSAGDDRVSADDDRGQASQTAVSGGSCPSSVRGALESSGSPGGSGTATAEVFSAQTRVVPGRR
jgi:hypothetical protein